MTEKDPKHEFTQKAGKNIPFAPLKAMRNHGPETAQAVMYVFKKLELPLPSSEEEAGKEREDDLIFLNRYGMVLRIDNRKSVIQEWGEKGRIRTPWMVAPIKAIVAGDVVLSLYPGARLRDVNNNDRKYLYRRLKEWGVEFTDPSPRNIGFSAYATPRFPNGVPLAIDGDSVALNQKIKNPCHLAPDQETQDVIDAEEAVHGPLRTAFAKAWAGEAKMLSFWDMCAQHVQEGKLIAGWESYASLQEYDSRFHACHAMRSGEIYEETLKTAQDKPRGNKPGL